VTNPFFVVLFLQKEGEGEGEGGIATKMEGVDLPWSIVPARDSVLHVNF